jgi:hypothetical protein
MGNTALPYRFTRSLNASMFLAVAATLWPRLRNASAQIFPNPLEAPVMKIVFVIIKEVK